MQGHAQKDEQSWELKTDLPSLDSVPHPQRQPLALSADTVRRVFIKIKKNNNGDKKSAHTLNVELIPEDLIMDYSPAIVSSCSNTSYEIFISRVKPILADRNIGNVVWEMGNLRLCFTTAQGHTNCPPLQERKNRPS